MYPLEHGKEVDLSKLRAEKMPLNDYQKAHKGLVIACCDVAIGYQGGILLVNRDNYPAKDVLWPLGGRLSRGVPQKESLLQLVKAESGIKLLDPIIYLGIGRTFFQTDPFGHGNGTDSRNAIYFARGEGKIKLDKLHSIPKIVKPEDYTPEFRATLEPYVQDFMDLVILMVGKSKRWLLETEELMKSSLRDIITRR